jgi:acetoin utilization protein AcuB
MSVQTIMTQRVVTVGMDDKLSVVNDVFQHCKFTHLLVVEEGVLVGIVSDGDLFKAISPNIGSSTESFKDAATLNKRVHQIMTRKPVSLRDDASIDDAIDLFNAHRISCIPIVNKANKPVGIVSWRDILKNLRPQITP